MIPRNAEQMIDDFKSFGAIGVIDPGNLHHLLIFKIVAQRDHHPGDRVACHGDAVFVGGKIMREQVGAEQLLELGRQGGARRNEGCRMSHQRSIVPVRRIFRCNCITP